MRRSRAPSNWPGPFFAARSWAGCTTNMFGFDLRQAQVVKSLALIGTGPVGLVRVQHPRVFKRKSPLRWAKAPVLWADVHLHGKGLRLGLLREYALHQGGIAIDAARPQ